MTLIPRTVGSPGLALCRRFCTTFATNAGLSIPCRTATKHVPSPRGGGLGWGHRPLLQRNERTKDQNND